MVSLCNEPSLFDIWYHTSEQNCVPLSEVMASGTPNRATQPEVKASATAVAVMLASGMASSHLVDLSMMVSR